jgi:hypothetical protein
VQERIARRAARDEIIGDTVKQSVRRNAVIFLTMPGQIPQAGEALDERKNQSNPRDDLIFRGEGADELDDRTDRASHAARQIGAGAMRLIAFGRRTTKPA